jgi:ribose/xylose/arabinose/galactoside ABC-type transport system permease subunit
VKTLDTAVAPAEKPTRRGHLADLLSLGGPYVGLLLVVLLFTIILWWTSGIRGVQLFLGPANLQLLAVHASIPAIVALGMLMIMISGGIDLSVGNVISLVTVTAMLAYRWAARHPALADTASLWAVAVGLGTGLVAGWLNGMLITRLQVVPFIVTLGTMGAARGLAQFLSGGSRVTFPGDSPRWTSWLGAFKPDPSWLGIGPAAWSVLLLAAAVAILLRYTVLGRYCYAIGSNEATARLCGIPVERTKVLIYTLGGLLTGWGGIVMLARSGAGSHDVATGYELDVIAAVVIGGGSLNGGEGTVTGTLAGALMMAVLANGCYKLGLQNEFRFIIIGLIIVLISAVNAWRQRPLTA